jgi:hypothetical protein
LLPFAIPAEFDSLLSAANQYVNDGGAWEEAEERLRLWLAYQQTFDRTGQYPSIPPGALPELPADLRDSFRTQFLPEFQKAFGNLLARNDSEFARRAFEPRHLQEIVAAVRRIDKRGRRFLARSGWGGE